MGLKLKLIVAASENLGIGKNGELPWRLKKEMAYFSRMTKTTKDPTKKNIVIMGRKTWESIPEQFRPLPGRINFILSRSNLDLQQYQDTFGFKSFETALDALSWGSFESVWVIGGYSVYKEALSSPYFDKLYLTKLHTSFECDTFLPTLPENLKEIREPEVPEELQEEDGLQYSYHVYEKA
ncbi:dihydrofolate reductase-like [Anthonomus grandis grandis]|uniref:dihydrofolate reductase-like n=1 Tax=Anthonomus grandis grandis TaxID=2921223 RepID=UPI002166429A|nr:dihydrofolate reductase-like [Anthonomus grandis grandis]